MVFVKDSKEEVLESAEEREVIGSGTI